MLLIHNHKKVNLLHPTFNDFLDQILFFAISQYNIGRLVDFIPIDKIDTSGRRIIRNEIIHIPGIDSYGKILKHTT